MTTSWIIGLLLYAKKKAILVSRLWSRRQLREAIARWRMSTLYGNFDLV